MLQLSKMEEAEGLVLMSAISEGLVDCYVLLLFYYYYYYYYYHYYHY